MNPTSRRGFLGALAGSGVALALPTVATASAAGTCIFHFGASRAVPGLGIAEDDLVAVCPAPPSITTNGRAVPTDWPALHAAVSSGALDLLDPDRLGHWPETVEYRRAARANYAKPLPREARARVAQIRAEVIAQHGITVWRRYRVLVEDWVRPLDPGNPFSASATRSVDTATYLVGFCEETRRTQGRYRYLLSSGREFVVTGLKWSIL